MPFRPLEPAQGAARHPDDQPRAAHGRYPPAEAPEAPEATGDGATQTARSQAAPEADRDTASEIDGAAGDRSIFKPLTGEAAENAPRELDMVNEIPVTLSVELGATRLTIRELLDLAKGSIVELDGLAGEPMDILINGYLIAQGEVVVVDDKYGIRITEIVTRAERIHKLHR